MIAHAPPDQAPTWPEHNVSRARSSRAGPAQTPPTWLRRVAHRGLCAALGSRIHSRLHASTTPQSRERRIRGKGSRPCGARDPQGRRLLPPRLRPKSEAQERADTAHVRDLTVHSTSTILHAIARSRKGSLGCDGVGWGGRTQPTQMDGLGLSGKGSLL